jgi:hypothetical protein
LGGFSVAAGDARAVEPGAADADLSSWPLADSDGVPGRSTEAISPSFKPR